MKILTPMVCSHYALFRVLIRLHELVFEMCEIMSKVSSHDGSLYV